MKKIAIIVIVGFYFAIACVSCSDKKVVENNKVIAQVGDNSLLLHDVLELLPKNSTKTDSIAFVKTYVDNWVRSKILYDIALEKISDSDGAIEKQVDRFREELYVNTYEQLFSFQKLDTIISQNLIDEYYAQHTNEYILRTDVVRPIYVVLPKTTDITKIKKWFLSSKDDDLDNLKDYCFQNSSKFYFGNQWIEFNNLIQEIPMKIANEQELLNPKGVILEDSLNYYFVKISAHLSPGQKKPKDIVYSEIAKILVHKRRIELLNTMRNKVYQDALHKKQFEVYY